MPTAVRRVGFLDGAFLLTLTTIAALAWFSAAVFAQPEPTPPRALEEIVVTARKIEENLQDVPIAITSLTPETLEQTSTFNVGDLQFLVPNLVTRGGQGQPTALVVTIRGQVQNDTLGTLDPSVGFYDDGLYVARPHGANAALVDVHDVQVLRGPQGTLFGRNTTGGAILLTTNDPDFEGIYGSVGGGVGNFGQRRLTGIMNLPLLDDRLALRIVGQSKDYDGYGFDRTNRRDIGSDANDLLRAKLLLQPLGNVRLLLAGQLIDVDQLGPPIDVIHGLTVDEVVAAGVDPTGCCLATLIAPDYNEIAGGDPYRSDFDPGLVPRSKARIESLSLNATWDHPWATAKFLAGVRKNDDVSNRIDIDGGPNKIVDTLQFSDNRQVSYELQLTGDLLLGRLQWALGATDVEENGSDNGSTPVFQVHPLLPPDLIRIDTRGDILNTGRGAYLQGNYAFTDRWGLTAGVRYSRDRKRLVLRATTSGTVCSIPDDLRDDSGECQGTFDKTFEDVSYLVSSGYKVFEGGDYVDDANVYASVATGYRSGGQNLRGADSRTLAPFDPETLIQYEVGFKSDLLERRVRFNGAAFFTRYDDIQRSTIIAVNGVPATVIENAAKAEIKGIELELSALPTDGLLLGGSLGITRPKYIEFVDATGADRSDEKFDEVPDMTFGLSAAHTSTVFGARWLNRLDYAWQDDVPTQQGGIQYFRERGFDPETEVTMPAQGYLNARSAIALANGLELGAYGRNLTDELRQSALILGQGPDFITRLVNGPGREFGVDFRIEF